MLLSVVLVKANCLPSFDHEKLPILRSSGKPFSSRLPEPSIFTIVIPVAYDLLLGPLTAGSILKPPRRNSSLERSSIEGIPGLSVRTIVLPSGLIDTEGVGLAVIILTISSGGFWYFRPSWATILTVTNDNRTNRNSDFFIMVVF